MPTGLVYAFAGPDLRPTSQRRSHLRAVAAGVNVAKPRPSATKRRRRR